ncbi:hypothetical protein [Metasolibacillus meyeri]|uniref:hypothetical protein n=1 Tax=Metasolibacillus meyeri TaxID=1071052 RepID=UPI000D313059|nr:hypothetical protein [Metasolibacillus meyeri]
MKPAVRLAQIIVDTPNWEQNPVLVKEVKKIRQLLGVSSDKCSGQMGAPQGYQYKMYRGEELVFEGTHKQMADYANVSVTTVYNRCATGRIVNGLKITRQKWEEVND